MIEVLFVDDERHLPELAKGFLKKQNEKLDVEAINSPKKALEKIKQYNYDCIVSDYQMSEINGLKLLEKVRKEFEISIPFIIFTGKGREEVAMKALNLGANRYIKKGGDPSSQFGVLADAIVQECERKEVEEKYKIVTEESANGIYVFQDGKFKFINEKFEEITGYNKKELNNIDYLDLVHPDHRKNIRKWTEKALTGNNSDLPEKFEFKGLRKDGDSIWVKSTPSLVEYKGRPAIVGNVIDITKQKKAEERKKFLHHLLRHDVQNKNQIIKDYLKLLKEMNLGKKAEEKINKALIAIFESEEIVEKVKALRKIDKEETREMDLNSILSKVISGDRAEAREKNIEIINNCPNSRCRVKAGSLLKELFHNLITYLIKNTKSSKIIITGEKREKSYLVTINSDGKELVEKEGINETKPSSYLAKEIANSYGGKIEVEPSELGGVKFNIYLKNPN